MNYERFVVAITRDSYMMYDALGISVSLGDLPSAEQLNSARRARYPGNRLGRFMLRLRPRVREFRQAQVEQWETVQRVEFVTRVMGEAQRMIDNQHE